MYRTEQQCLGLLYLEEKLQQSGGQWLLIEGRVVTGTTCGCVWGAETGLFIGLGGDHKGIFLTTAYESTYLGLFSGGFMYLCFILQLKC